MRWFSRKIELKFQNKSRNFFLMLFCQQIDKLSAWCELFSSKQRVSKLTIIFSESFISFCSFKTTAYDAQKTVICFILKKRKIITSSAMYNCAQLIRLLYKMMYESCFRQLWKLEKATFIYMMISLYIEILILNI